ncbi:hypothetical protein BDY17DRAFT_292448 [Neohortaea acidophila]|uniref:SnoaL-like domain-containing protein n=1 Tax=Neohortaea acidophila TaxID=245834 RepID=A0A6A6PXT8_9PEZI|nr:uncharacterized protein BDY17DRAFT_292448 [Neohortaea acidophila]KAF2484825.1 hypothetical protein BDY17DRAFT_292448 [Neohortaea acidophila]
MSPNAFDYIAIQNTLAKYCMALDSKTFHLLDDVFTPNVQVRYPIEGFDAAKDLESLIQRLEKRLEPVTTHHALTTQHIVIADDGKTAEATTYFTGVHFGTGKWEGRQSIAWGKYQDGLVLDGEGGKAKGVPGASGRWLIARREVTIMKRTGEERIME